jgi:hypothetical protein
MAMVSSYFILSIERLFLAATPSHEGNANPQPSGVSAKSGLFVCLQNGGVNVKRVKKIFFQLLPAYGFS